MIYIQLDIYHIILYKMSSVGSIALMKIALSNLTIPASINVTHAPMKHLLYYFVHITCCIAPTVHKPTPTPTICTGHISTVCISGTVQITHLYQQHVQDIYISTVRISHTVQITHLYQQHVQDISLVSVIRTSHIPHTCANSMFFPIFSSVQTSLVLLLVTFRIHSLSSPK